MFFPLDCGRSCSFDEILAVSGAGPFTFAYDEPYLYVTDEGTSGDGVLKIYNISNPVTPVLLSTTSLPTDSFPRFPQISGDQLFIPYRDTANVNRYITIWDVSNPSSPSLLGQTANLAGTTGKASGLEIIGTQLFVAVAFGGNYFEKYNISDPTSPTFVSGLTNTGGLNCTGIAQSGGNLFVVMQQGSGGSFSCRAINQSASLLSSVSNGLTPTGSTGPPVIHSDGVHLYAQENNGSDLTTVNISNPSSLSIISRVSMTQTGTTTSGFGSIALVEETERLYCGRSNGGGLCIPIMDIADKDTPAVSGSISTSNETVTDLVNVTGCPGLIYGQGTGAAIHLLGRAPLS